MGDGEFVGFVDAGFDDTGFGVAGFGVAGFGVDSGAGGASIGRRSGRSSSNTLRFTPLLVGVALVAGVALVTGVALFVVNGCSRRSACSKESADGTVAFVSGSAGATLPTVANAPESLSSDSQSSSSFFEGEAPGTRIGALHFGQLNFCPASFAGALNFLSH
jgi:hypothetical protein